MVDEPVVLDLPWRALLWKEEVSRLPRFGTPIFAPGPGTVVAAHDGEVDHAARRSQLTLVPYLASQGQRPAW